MDIDRIIRTQIPDIAQVYGGVRGRTMSSRHQTYAWPALVEAAAYVSDSAIKGNLEHICSVLLEYDIEYVLRVFDKWLTLLWSALSTFEALCHECVVFHQLREKLFPDNKDLLSIMYFTPDRRKKAS